MLSSTPIPAGQVWLIEPMQQLGYQADEGGVCFGIANMAMQAILAEETDLFDERLRAIRFIPKKKFVSVINKIKKERKINKPAQIILYEEIPAFFEGIEFFQNCNNYPKWFEDTYAPKNQNTLQTANLILSQKLEAKGGISKLAAFCGAYELKELTTYFSTLAQALSKLKEPVALILSSSDHSITVGFNPKKNEWLFIDGNQLPTQHIESNRLIAEKVLHALTQNKVTVFKTEVYAHNARTHALSDCVAAWQHKKDFKKIHKITPKKLEWHDSQNATLLYAAVDGNHIQAVKEIVDLQKENSNKDFMGCCPAVCLAAVRGNVEVLKILIEEAHLDPNIKVNNETPLYKASRKNNLEVVKYLLKCNQVDINLACQKGNTALHVAAENGNVEIIRELLQADADINQADSTGRTPLYVAVEEGRFDIVLELLKFKVNINEADLTGKTPLFIAAQKGYSAILEVLLDSKADSNIPRNTGTTPFLVAAQYGQERVIEKLINAKVDLDQTRSDGASALFLAAQEGHLKVVKSILTQKTNPNKSKHDGSTPLFIASANGRVGIVKQLLKAKADPNIERRYDGVTALDMAVQNNHFKVVETLLKTKVDINHQVNGKTALFRAAQNGNVNMVKLLLDHRANPNVIFQATEKSLLTLAQQKGVVLKMDIFIKMKQRQSNNKFIPVTPLEIAKILGHVGVVNLLKSLSPLPRFSVFSSAYATLQPSHIQPSLPLVKVSVS